MSVITPAPAIATKSMPAANRKIAQPSEPVIRRKMSWDEYLALPAQPKAEWVAGEAIIMAPPTFKHADAAGEIFYALRDSLTGVKVLMDAGVKFPGWARLPDITVIAQKPTDPIWITSPPLLAVEVLSPATRAIDLFDKARQYQEAGFGQYWVADPISRTILVRENTPDGWRTIAIIDAANPIATVVVPGHGEVQLIRDKIFDEDRDIREKC